MFPIQKIRQRLLVLVCIAVVMPEIAAGDLLEEIVVTADYRERTLAELPLSISIINTETINGNAIQHFEELTAIVPNRVRMEADLDTPVGIY